MCQLSTMPSRNRELHRANTDKGEAGRCGNIKVRTSSVKEDSCSSLSTTRLTEDLQIVADTASATEYQGPELPRVVPWYCRRKVRLACLAVLLMVVVLVIAGHQRNFFRDLDAAFDSPLDEDDAASLDRTLGALTSALDRAGIIYFMTSGTLLGSYRHHGRIPWDDDVDLMLNASQKMEVFRTLTALMPDYGLFLSGTMESPYHWKFYPRVGGRWVPFRPFRWPYVDLLFFRENSTHVWNGSPNLADEIWPRWAVFPLRRRPYYDLSLPAPCDTATVLAINFDLQSCRSRDFSHAFDLPMPRSGVSMPCERLQLRYPFVQRRSLNAGGQTERKRPAAVSETLISGSVELHRTVVLNGCS